MKRNALPIAVAAALAAAAPFAAGNARAQTAPGQPLAFEATLYGWFPDISGKTTFPGATGLSDFRVGIDKILDNLEATFQGTLDVRKDRWGALADLVYMNVSASQSGVADATVGAIGLPVGASATVNLGVNARIWTLGGYYRAIEGPAHTMDLVAGARYLDVEQTASWTITGNVGSIPLPGRAGQASASLGNWDAIVGVRGRWSPGANKAWHVPYYVDVGTGESDFTWSAMAGVGYAFRWGSIAAGWRHMSYDMASGSRIADMTFSGPIVGATFRW